MTIHTSHPFAETETVSGRQLRGRLGNRVTLLCAGELGSHLTASGLTVSSALVVPGEPWRVVAFVDPDSDVADAIERTGRATWTLLEWHHRELAERFGARLPSPGGPFRHGVFAQTEHGPIPADAGTWAALELESRTEVGWMLQLTMRAVDITVGSDEQPLHHLRGAYTSLGCA